MLPVVRGNTGVAKFCQTVHAQSALLAWLALCCFILCHAAVTLTLDHTCAAASRSGGARGGRRGGSNGRGSGRSSGGGVGEPPSAIGGAGSAIGAADVRREDGSVQCTFSSNGDDFFHQHW